MLGPSDLSVVIVLYNSGESIARTVAAIPADAELILVDNGSSDDGLERALAERPAARWLREPNRGFGAGCNRGAEIASRRALMFLNPDAELLPRTVEAMLAALAHEPTAVVGALHTTEAGEPLGNCRRRSEPFHEILELLPSAARWVPERLGRDVPVGDPLYRTGGPVPYVQGACFALMREVFLTAGGFDERFFLYSEEEDLANRVRGQGGRSLLVADARLSHEGESTTKQVALFALGHLYRSRVIFYADRDGLGTAVLFSLGLCLAAGIQLGVRLVKGAESPASALAWFRAVVLGLAGGLAQARRPPELLNMAL